MLSRIIRSAAAAIAVALSLMMIAGCGKMNTNSEDSGFGEELPQYNGTGITGLRTSGSAPTGTGLARNINITGNVFYNVDGTAVFACNTTGITVKENLVYGAMSLTNKYYAIRSALYV